MIIRADTILSLTTGTIIAVRLTGFTKNNTKNLSATQYKIAAQSKFSSGEAPTQLMRVQEVCLSVSLHLSYIIGTNAAESIIIIVL